MTEYRYAIVEPVGLDKDQTAYWTSCSLPKTPLMQQAAFQHLQHEGPWLVTLDGDHAVQLEDLQRQVGDQAVIGWLSSFLPAEKICLHLSHALVATMSDGKTVLLRSYSRQVLPVLHARNDCEWHQSLFGPINGWWLKNDDKVQHIQGLGRDFLPDYQCITLDDLLLETLAVDQQALTLLEEMETSAAHVFTSECHGDRLKLVEQALSCARKSGLENQNDQLLFATLSLLEGAALDTAQYWPDVLAQVLEQEFTLGEALESKVGGELI